MPGRSHEVQTWRSVGQAFDTLADAHVAFVGNGPVTELDETVRTRLRSLASSRPVGWAADLGCGGGTNAQVLLATGWSVHLIDASARMLSHARSRLGPPSPNIYYTHGDAEQSMTTSARRYDLALMIGEILAYVDSPAGLLRAIVGRLQPGAPVIGSFMRRSVMLERLGDHEIRSNDPGEVNFVERPGVTGVRPALCARAYDDEYLVDLLECAGLTIAELMAPPDSPRGGFLAYLAATASQGAGG